MPFDKKGSLSCKTCCDIKPSVFVGVCGERPQSDFKTSKDTQGKLNIPIGMFGKN